VQERAEEERPKTGEQARKQAAAVQAVAVQAAAAQRLAAPAAQVDLVAPVGLPRQQLAHPHSARVLYQKAILNTVHNYTCKY